MNVPPGILYPARVSFRIKGLMKSFQGKHKLKGFITTDPALKEMLKVI